MIRAARDDDREAVIALWEAAKLTRPWNDPREDFARATQNVTSEIFLAEEDNQLVGTIMCGYDGHRGWVYYLAVKDASRRLGIGSDLLAHAEEWLASIGAPKMLLMVRNSNSGVKDFYLKQGYTEEETTVLGKLLQE